MQFKVALLFAGENRAFIAEGAQEVHKMLGPGTVFYDNNFEV